MELQLKTATVEGKFLSISNNAGRKFEKLTSLLNLSGKESSVNINIINHYIGDILLYIIY